MRNMLERLNADLPAGFKKTTVKNLIEAFTVKNQVQFTHMIKRVGYDIYVLELLTNVCALLVISTALPFSETLRPETKTNRIPTWPQAEIDRVTGEMTQSLDKDTPLILFILHTLSDLKADSSTLTLFWGAMYTFGLGKKKAWHPKVYALLTQFTFDLCEHIDPSMTFLRKSVAKKFNRSARLA